MLLLQATDAITSLFSIEWNAFASAIVGAVIGGAFTLAGSYIAHQSATKLEQDRQAKAELSELRAAQLRVWSRLKGLQYSVTSFAWLRMGAQINALYHTRALELGGVSSHEQDARYNQQDTNRLLEALAIELKEVEMILGEVELLFALSSELERKIGAVAALKVPDYTGPKPAGDMESLETWRKMTLKETKASLTLMYERPFTELLEALRAVIPGSR